MSYAVHHLCDRHMHLQSTLLEVCLRTHVYGLHITHFHNSECQSRAEEHVPQREGHGVRKSREGQNPFVVHNDGGTEEDPKCHISASSAPFANMSSDMLTCETLRAGILCTSQTSQDAEPQYKLAGELIPAVWSHP